MKRHAQVLTNLLLSLLLAATVQVAAQQSNMPDPSATQIRIKYIPIKWVPAHSGQQMYTAYCASCHGAAGMGDGPAAPALTPKPTDLTQLSAQNDGRFPELYVIYLLSNADRRSNGPSEMPSWCPILRSLNSNDYIEAGQRAYNLMRHLKTLQAPALQASTR